MVSSALGLLCLELECLLCPRPLLVIGGLVVLERFAVGGEHFVEVVAPFDHAFTEATLQEFKHCCWGDRSTWGGAEDAGDGAVLVVDQRGAEFEAAEAWGCGGLDHLHTLAGNDLVPILWVCVRVVLAQDIHFALEVAEYFLDQVGD